MKKLFFIFLIFCSCKKDSEQKIWIQVKDLITNSPVNGATVDVFKCIPSDPWCGLIPWQSSLTGMDGRCSFNKADFDKVTFTQVYKADYWGSGRTKNTSVGIYPQGWMRLRIIRGTSYPTPSYLKILVYSSDPSYISSADCNTPADSSILVRCFGGQLNRIDWRVTGSTNNELNSGTWNQQIPRLDTINATLNY